MRQVADGNFFPFGRDMTAEEEADIKIQYGDDWPSDYENICVTAWAADVYVAVLVSDDPSSVSAGISLITLLEENFRDSSCAGPRDEKAALEKLRECINKLIAAREQELRDYPELEDGEWPAPEWIAERQGSGS